MTRKPFLPLAVLACTLLALPRAGTQAKADKSKPLRALLVCGGCCHDYATQHKLLSAGIQERANVVVDVVYSTDGGTSPRFPMYETGDWAQGYDVVIHDECAADVKDMPYVENIVNAHKTVPSVNLHCAMHCYRTGTDLWFKYLGLQSSGHGPQLPIEITFTDKAHPITKTLGDWTTINEELYNNVAILGGKALAKGKQTQPNGKADEFVVAWTNETEGARSFSTTIGHNNETVADDRYLDLVVRGLLWACDKLDDAHLVAYAGDAGKVTVLEKIAPPPPKLPEPPKDATVIVPSASSEETGKDNLAWRAFDGNHDTRWCAGGAGMPQWLQFDFDKAQKVAGVKIVWESENNAYAHKIEGSLDGKAWTLLSDATANPKSGNTNADFPAKEVRFVRITCTGTSAGGWASIREITVKAEGVKSIAPKMTPEMKKAAAADPYKEQGNVPPAIVNLTPAEEAAILGDVKIPEDFEMSLFASAAAANYPVYVAAAPNGDLYVSSDGNGSLGRKPHRGRILRLRDTDQDGRADEVKEFVKDIDSPRGLVWDQDRLYLVHPPHVSVFIDKDGDGVSDESKTLIEGIAFGFKDRPADHTTNGLSLGIDGWLYIAGGDFGFMDAVGTDGRHLQHRGGGVIRFRPDGSNLEIYSDGTRNILEVAISPLMDIFARDNTNDGGGWDIRFHHFSGLENHGYPRLYMNFNDEIVQPLADYGGGSGCGAVYIDEPGFGKWNGPLTCDWGTGALWHQSVAPKGATFAETAKPEAFIRVTRPTDCDVDGMGHVYLASWKGATFDWEGPNVGYIVRVTPKGFKPDAMPDFGSLDDTQLVAQLESPSHRRRLEAQRTLVRRGLGNSAAALASLMSDKAKPLASRVTAAYALSLGGKSPSALPAGDDPLLPYAIRAFENAATPDLTASPNPRVRLEATLALTRSGKLDGNPNLATLLGDPDPVVAHTVVRCLAFLEAVAPCLAVLDDSTASDAARAGAARALAMIHAPASVDGLVARLASTTGEKRQPILAALCRLYHHEGTWKGDSWGTRPDTRGPYYQPETWAESAKIAATLTSVLDKAAPEEASFLVAEMSRNRMETGDALGRVLALATKDPALVPKAIAQLAKSEAIPAGALPLLVSTARNAKLDPAVLANAITALGRVDGDEACAASLDALAHLTSAQKSDTAREAFLQSPKLENHHQFLEKAAEKLDGVKSAWADAALLALSVRKAGSPEARELSAKALDAGWNDSKRRAQIIEAAALANFSAYAPRILASINDGAPAVASAAQRAATAMHLQESTVAKGPLIGTLKPEDVLAQVANAKGDVKLGEQLFTTQTCVACHTVSQDQPPKGPYLGNIAQTYPRAELAQNILDPNRTIAQGFVSEIITEKAGTTSMGFITFESADEIKFRDIAAVEHTLAVRDIAKRDKLPTSIMPPGLINALDVREFASLLDYLESLVKQ